MHSKQGPANVNVERIVEALLGNGAKWLTELTIAGASKEDVNATLLLFDRLDLEKWLDNQELEYQRMLKRRYDPENPLWSYYEMHEDEFSRLV